MKTFNELQVQYNKERGMANIGSYRVRYTITGYAEVRAANPDDAYDAADKMGVGELLDHTQGDPSIDLELPEEI